MRAFIAGTALIAFGVSNVIEAPQDMEYGVMGSSEVSCNIIRDGLLKENEELCYGLEMQ